MSTGIRHFLQRAAAVLILSIFTVSCYRNVPIDSARPNIILIVTDDQNADTTAFMPTVQRLLVDQGTTFTSAYATTPICVPSRASILTGQYAHNHGVLSNDGTSGGFPSFFTSGAENSTLATSLKRDGYYTALVGKYFNAYPEGKVSPEGFTSPGERYVPPGWNEWFGFLDFSKAGRPSPYAMYNYAVNQNGQIKRYGNSPRDYQTDVLSDVATDFVKRGSRQAKPFFLYLAPTAPHLQAISAPRHQDMFAGVQAPRSPSFNEADISDKPAWLAGKPLMSPGRIAVLDETYRKQAQMLLAVDEMIASLLRTLEATGELESTYIVFTSDHGLHNGDHRLANDKFTPYGASAHVPLVVRGPGVPAGQTVDALSLLSDLTPTFTDLVDAPTPDLVDGRSLASWLGKGNATPERQSERRQVLHEFWPKEGFPPDSPRPLPIPAYSALRSSKYLYVDYSYADGRTERELYDLERDPFELDNIAATADDALISALSVKLDALRTCQAAACREAENSPL